MKLKQLNEATLIEKEVSGLDLKDIEVSTKVADLIKNQQWQNAYKEASIGVDEQQLYVVFIEYYPSKAHNDQAKKAGGILVGSDSPENVIKGYLQENKNKPVEAGGFLNLKNITTLGSELVDIVDPNNTTKIIREGYFKLVKTPEGATPYSKENANILIKKLKGIGGGVRAARAEPVRREDLGKTGSEKDLVIKEYLKTVFGADEAKIEPFRDLVIKIAGELGLDKNPIINFLREYIKLNEMERQGFITLNNLYANRVIENTDLLSSNITPLLKSDLLVKTPSADAEYIIETYRELLYAYRNFNAEELSVLAREKYGEKNITKIINKDRSLNKNWKKNLADALVYKANSIGKSVESADYIEQKMDKLELAGNKAKEKTIAPKASTKVAGQPQAASAAGSTPAIKVTGVPGSLSPEAEGKYKAVLQGITKEDVPELMAYLKKNKLIDVID